jgi:hypothetical protein
VPVVAFDGCVRELGPLLVGHGFHGGPHLWWDEACSPVTSLVWIQMRMLGSVIRIGRPQWKQVRLSPSDQVEWLPRTLRLCGTLIRSPVDPAGRPLD